MRIPDSVLNDLDDYAAADGKQFSRSQAVRTILADWLRTHGFTVKSYPKPTGPATEAVEAMDAAIKEDRGSKRKRASLPIDE